MSSAAWHRSGGDICNRMWSIFSHKMCVQCSMFIHRWLFFFIFFCSCVWAMVECHRWLVNGKSAHDSHGCQCEMPDRISLVFLLNETRKSQCINSPRKNVKSFPLYCFWIKENMAWTLHGSVKNISKIKEEWTKRHDKKHFSLNRMW